MAETLPVCALQFIRNFLCTNETFKSTFKTFLNGLILTAQGEIVLLSSQIARLDILNAFADLEIKTLAAVQNKIKSDLNVVFGPMQTYADCSTINSFMRAAQSGSTAKALASMQNLIYTYNRRAFVYNTLTSEKKQLEKLVAQAQEFLNQIDTVCSLI